MSPRDKHLTSSDGARESLHMNVRGNVTLWHPTTFGNTAESPWFAKDLRLPTPWLWQCVGIICCATAAEADCRLRLTGISAVTINRSGLRHDTNVSEFAWNGTRSDRVRGLSYRCTTHRIAR